MHTIRTAPWALLDGINRDLDHFLLAPRAERNAAHWVPPVDIVEYEDRFEIVADIPGIAAEQLDVTLDKGVLTVAGARTPATPDDGRAARRAERPSGRFERQFRLPEAVAADGLSATCADGVVTISVPKQQPPAPLRVEVRHR